MKFLFSFYIVSAVRALEPLSEVLREITGVIKDSCGKQGRVQEDIKGNSVYFNAYSSQPHNCDYGCNVTYTDVYADSHNAVDISNGVFICPRDGDYLFQFNALVESEYEARVRIFINSRPVMYLYDRDIGGHNRRYAMIGQSLIHPLRTGDSVFVNLHRGHLKGGGNLPFTSFLGLLIR